MNICSFWEVTQLISHVCFQYQPGHEMQHTFNQNESQTELNYLQLFFTKNQIVQGHIIQDTK